MYLIETVNRDKYTELHIFSRNKEGKKITKIVKDFKPYFYVPENDVIPDDSRICSVEKGHISILGEKVKKIVVSHSGDVKDIKDLFSKSYESDILFAKRYIVDVLGEVETYPLKTLSLDIETDDINGFPDSKKPEQIITCVSFCDNYGKKATFLYLSKESKSNMKNSDILRVFKSEEDMLNASFKYVIDEDPDILTGWNVIDFDLNYLFARSTKLDVNYKSISPLNTVMVDDKWKQVKIKGRVVLDGLQLYEHYRKISNQGRAESYSLEFTSQEVLGAGKVTHDDNFHDMWINKPELLAEYNLRDAELVINILTKLDIVEFFNSIRSKSFSQLEDIYMTTKLIDGLLLYKCKGKIVLPSKRQNKEEGFIGGAVFTPKPGLYDYVLVFDVKGMYPNLIKTFNIGYETFNPKGEIKLRDGIAFNKGVGLISQLMRDLEKERQIYKDLMKKSKTETERKNNYYKQYAIKVLMNGHFGYLGYPGSRLYNREVAEAITSWGQSLIRHVEEVLSKKGYKLIYGDTDSVFFAAKSKNLELVKIEGEDLLELVNSTFVDFATRYGSDDCTLSMEFEKVFKRAIFIGKKGGKKNEDDEVEGAKKKYAYILAWKGDEPVSDKIGFTGIDGKRSDTPRIAKTTQIKVFDMILKGESKETIVEYLKDLNNKIRSGEIGVEEIGFPKGISKDMSEYGKVKSVDGKDVKTGMPPIIKGCYYANKYLGKRFGIGSKPKFIYIKTVPEGYPPTEVLSFEHDIPKGFIPDYDLMTDRIFKMKLEEIFRSAGFGDFPEFNLSLIEKTKEKERKLLEKENNHKEPKLFTIKNKNILTLNAFMPGET